MNTNTDIQKPCHDFLSFHNTCIAKDCIGITSDADLIKAKDRFTLDDCDNIIAIDGRAVIGGNLVYRLA